MGSQFLGPCLSWDLGLLLGLGLSVCFSVGLVGLIVVCLRFVRVVVVESIDDAIFGAVLRLVRLVV